jgi:hypothetical protein
MTHRLLTVVSLVILWAIPATPQEAAIAELSKEDSAKAADLYKRLKAAEKDWADFKTTIRRKYGPDVAKGLPPQLVVDEQTTEKDRIVSIPMPVAWFQIEFSSDFRFVVPAARTAER